MPRGGARPGAGRPRKPITTHLLQGSYRRDRHGPCPTNVVAMPAPVIADWRPSKSNVRELGPRARLWLEAVVRVYRLEEIEGLALMESLRTLTRIERDPDPKPNLSRLFLSQWESLRLGREKK